MAVKPPRPQLWTPEPGKVWIPPRDVLVCLRDEGRVRLEKEYHDLYRHLTGVRPTGDWLDLYIGEIARWAAPVVVQTGSRGTIAGGSGNVVASLSGGVNGNTVLCGVALNEFTTSTSPLTTPSGWTAIVSNPATGTATYRPQTAIFRKTIATSPETCTLTTLGTDSYGYAQCIEISGIASVDTGASVGSDNANGTATTATVTSPSPTSAADSIIFAINTAETGGGGTGTHSTPASLNGSTSGVTSIGTNANDSATIAYDFSRKIISAIATPAATWTWTGASRYNNSLAILSGAGGGAATSLLALFLRSTRFYSRRRYS